MDNQHREITGYRELTEAEIALMNEVKQHGEDLDALVTKLHDVPDVDQRWVAIGRTELQQGLMALVRAVARPTSF
jgi:hypothetical protein